MIKISEIDAIVLRFPLENPVQTSFGLMLDRPMLIVKLTTDEGIIGWGEVWCNFPNAGAEHRANLINQVFKPVILKNEFLNPESAFDFLTHATWVLGLQTGEIGPLAQCIAGLEIAFSDIYGKIKDQPLWKIYGGKSDKVPVYASGINPSKPELIATQAVADGYKSLKLKVGFGKDRDLNNITNIKNSVEKDIDLMVDANQAWSISDALEIINELENFHLSWLEEPIAADRPVSEWTMIANKTSIPLAAGENIYSEDAFKKIIDDGCVYVIQPDIAKWGGFSKTIKVARKIVSAGKRYCPHYLGGGIGLVASAHALAAIGGNGMLEVDINHNPLRSQLCGDLLNLSQGVASIGGGSGLGFTPDIGAVEIYRIQ